MSEKYVVQLRMDERKELTELITKGTDTARRIRRAHILLLADEDKPDTLIAATLHTSLSTIERTRKRLVEGNVAGALTDKPHPKRGTPPEGHAKWTMQLLATRLIELKVVDTISDETVRQELKKTN
jgi:hypothetical protein